MSSISPINEKNYRFAIDGVLNSVEANLKKKKCPFVDEIFKALKLLRKNPNENDLRAKQILLNVSNAAKQVVDQAKADSEIIKSELQQAEASHQARIEALADKASKTLNINEKLGIDRFKFFKGKIKEILGQIDAELAGVESVNQLYEDNVRVLLGLLLLVSNSRKDDLEKAIQMLNQKPDSNVHFLLGLVYQNGLFGCQKDLQKAIDHLAWAAKVNTLARLEIGAIYWNGIEGISAGEKCEEFLSHVEEGFPEYYNEFLSHSAQDAIKQANRQIALKDLNEFASADFDGIAKRLLKPGHKNKYSLEYLQELASFSERSTNVSGLSLKANYYIANKDKYLDRLETELKKMSEHLKSVEFPESDIYADLGRIHYYKGIYQELSALWTYYSEYRDGCRGCSRQSNHTFGRGWYGHTEPSFISIPYSDPRIYQDKYFEKAVNLWQKAVEKGSAKGQYYLGLAYCSGRGIDQNWEKGKELLEKAKENNYLPAKIMLEGFKNRKNSKTAIKAIQVFKENSKDRLWILTPQEEKDCLKAHAWRSYSILDKLWILIKDYAITFFRKFSKWWETPDHWEIRHLDSVTAERRHDYFKKTYLDDQLEIIRL